MKWENNLVILKELKANITELKSALQNFKTVTDELTEEVMTLRNDNDQLRTKIGNIDTKASGHDELTTKIIKNNIHDLKTYKYTIISKCIETGMIADGMSDVSLQRWRSKWIQEQLRDMLASSKKQNHGKIINEQPFRRKQSI